MEEYIVKIEVTTTYTKRLIADSEEEAIKEAKFILENRTLDAFNQVPNNGITIKAERV